MATFDRTRYLEAGGVKKTPVYAAWDSMIQRCTNPNNQKYHAYGGRGILVCDSWLEFDQFYIDMGVPPLSYQIDRKNNDEGYCPSNCRWVSRSVNMRNRRNNNYITYDGVTRVLEEWGEVTGIKSNTILTRLRRNWPVGEALGIEEHHNRTTLTAKEKENRLRSCQRCGAKFTPRIGQIKAGQGIFCSLKCTANNALEVRWGKK